jgi:hypothetical protein
VLQECYNSVARVGYAVHQLIVHTPVWYTRVTRVLQEYSVARLLQKYDKRVVKVCLCEISECRGESRGGSRDESGEVACVHLDI